MAASNTQAISASVAASVSRGNALSTSLTRALAGVNSTMIASVAGKADEDKHIWLGGCSGGGGCWSDRCLDRVELDTARPKFYKRTNTRMRAISTGFYRMNMWEINHRNWAHLSVRHDPPSPTPHPTPFVSFLLVKVAALLLARPPVPSESFHRSRRSADKRCNAPARFQVFINGQRKTQTYMHTYHGWWKDQHQDHTHYIPAGQDFWFQTCGGAHGWGSGNSHHRQEFHWVGTRPS